MAVEGNWRDIAFYLIHNGADVQAKNVLHRTPLHLAAANGRLELGVMLLKAGADPHVTDINGWNPRQVGMSPVTPPTLCMSPIPPSLPLLCSYSLPHYLNASIKFPLFHNLYYPSCCPLPMYTHR